MRRQLRPLIRGLMSHCLPKDLRHQLYRNMISLGSESPPGIRFKIAETREELSQAFRLLHRAYVSQGYMDPHPSGMRITKYHALHSTTTLIALQGDRVVGTLSLVRSNPFGLPCEKAYDLSLIKTRRASIAEVSALAVSREYSHRQGEILFPLLKFMYEYAVGFFALDHLAIVVHPTWFEFYEALLFFQAFQKKSIDYDFVKHAPGMGGWLDLRKARSLFERVYGHKPPRTNLFRYFTKLRFDGFEFPDRRSPSVLDPVMTPELLDYFFNRSTRVFSELSVGEKTALHRLYDTPEYQRILPHPPLRPSVIEAGEALRLEKRFDVDARGWIQMPHGTEAEIQIKNISLGGIGAVTALELRAGEAYSLRLRIGNSIFSDVKVVPAWHQPDGGCGFWITQAPEGWSTLVECLDESLIHVA